MTKKPRRPARTFGEITKQPSDRFRARYWGPDGQRYNAPRTYVARTDAEGWLSDQERAISRGDWEPPRPAPKPAPAMVFGAYAKQAIKQRHLRPSTVELYEEREHDRVGEPRRVPTRQAWGLGHQHASSLSRSIVRP